MTKKPQITVKRIKVLASHGFPAVEKEVVFLAGRGENCQCGDCPVLYGGTCPFDDESL